MIYGIIAALDEELLPLLERTEVHESKACCGTTIYRGELGDGRPCSANARSGPSTPPSARIS